MPIQMYIYAAIMALGLVIGGTTMYKIEHGNVLKLELAISQANTQAAEVLAIETSKVAVAEKETRKQNEELDKSNEKNTNTINSYNIKLADALRLHNNSSKNDSNALPSNPNTVINPENGKTEDNISGKLAKLLQSETARADKITVQYNTLLEFVKDNNCGIIK